MFTVFVVFALIVMVVMALIVLWAMSKFLNPLFGLILLGVLGFGIYNGIGHFRTDTPAAGAFANTPIYVDPYPPSGPDDFVKSADYSSAESTETFCVVLGAIVAFFVGIIGTTGGYSWMSNGYTPPAAGVNGATGLVGTFCFVAIYYWFTRCHCTPRGVVEFWGGIHALIWHIL